MVVMIMLAATSASRSSANAVFHPTGGNDSTLGWRLSRIEGNQTDIEKYATTQVQPAYPETAQKYRIEGIVKVQVVVNPDGKVTKAEFVRGHGVFKAVSLEAAKQWLFRSPDNVEMEGTITFTFKLKS